MRARRTPQIPEHKERRKRKRNSEIRNNANMITDLVLGVSQLIDIDRDGGLGLIGLGIVLGSHGGGGKKKFRSGGQRKLGGVGGGGPLNTRRPSPQRRGMLGPHRLSLLWA